MTKRDASSLGLFWPIWRDILRFGAGFFISPSPCQRTTSWTVSLDPWARLNRAYDRCIRYPFAIACNRWDWPAGRIQLGYSILHRPRDCQQFLRASIRFQLEECQEDLKLCQLGHIRQDCFDVFSTIWAGTKRYPSLDIPFHDDMTRGGRQGRFTLIFRSNASRWTPRPYT